MELENHNEQQTRDFNEFDQIGLLETYLVARMNSIHSVSVICDSVDEQMLKSFHNEESS